MTIWEIFFQIPLVLLTVVIHEIFHYSVAYFLGYNPKFEFEKFLIPSVKFRNKGRDIENLIIALAAPIGLMLIGYFIPNNIAFLSLVRLVCFLNVLHILPFCADGQIILLSILNFVRRKGMKKFIKIIIVSVMVVASFIVGYHWAIGSDEIPVYNTNTPQFIHENPENVMQKIEDGKKGVYYFGFARCPWCVELLPILDNTLATTKQRAYVIDTKSESFTADNREQLESFYDKYHDDDVSVPFLIVISEDGTVKTHVGTVEGHDAHGERLTDEQKKELEQLLLTMFI